MEEVFYFADFDGRILSGVAKEVAHAKVIGIPVIEIPSSVEERSIIYPQTKEFLKQIGFYKCNKEQ